MGELAGFGGRGSGAAGSGSGARMGAHGSYPRGPQRNFESEAVSTLHVSVWHGEATTLDMDEFDAELMDVVHRHGAVSILLIVEPSCPLAGDVARKRAVAMLDALGDAVESVAVVVEGTGFWAGAMRSVFNGLSLALRPRFPWKTFNFPSDALAWQRSVIRTGEFSSNALKSLVRELQQRVPLMRG